MQIKWYEDPVYRKMSEKAEEIQELYNPNEFGFLYDHVVRYDYDRDKYKYKEFRRTRTSFGNFYIARHVFSSYDGYEWSCIWLPSQAQLQQMVTVEEYNRSMYPVLEDFYQFACSMYKNSYPPTSMSKLWLAFVMKEKYNKVWNGDKWQKE